MLNTVKPVHINIGDGSAGTGIAGNAGVGTPVGLIPQLYAYEAVPAAGANALRITVPGMGAGQAPASGSRSTWRKGTWITVSNLDASDHLQISFDNGNNFFTIGDGEKFTADIYFRHFFLRAAVTGDTNIQVECIVGINQT